jgi:uncharacterized membrane protein (UPF0127 family)
MLTLSGCPSVQLLEPPAAVFPSGAVFRLEIAADDRSRARGYMFREHVAADEGMLFVFNAPGRHAFWMRDCRVNLDIIWIDEERRVVEIAHDQAPCHAEGTCPNIFPMRSASYVLEVAGGTARREGLGLGDPVALYLEQSNGD